MKSRLKAEAASALPTEILHRCRPLLGTFVEITASGGGDLADSMNAAFEVIAKVQSLMSVHDEGSELSEVNRAAHLRPIQVGAQTFAVLERSHALAEHSEGAFDFTVGATLARWGLLPKALRRRAQGNWRDMELLSGNRVRFRRPLAIDLGGIAKGYAVDCAVRALQDHGVASGVVNAGGDLRVFGNQVTTIHLRHPGAPQLLVNPMLLRNTALATSSPCFTQCRWRDRAVSHLVAQDRRSARTQSISVSVRASECWLADALTKVVLNNPARAAALLSYYEAEAFILTA